MAIWNCGASQRSIAQALGTTKNLIAGRLARWIARTGVVLPLRHDPDGVLRGSGREPKPAFDFDESGCRFPFGDPQKSGFRYCGEPIVTKRFGSYVVRSWCVEHLDVVYPGGGRR